MCRSGSARCWPTTRRTGPIWCGGNYDATARALVIHRSTLRYRLRRIREISDLDIGEVNVRLNLHIATRAHNVLQGLP
ncbi:helix-turn-helix domain-containing protein [Pseudonocardia hydrocarbonoxydans]|uniref:helix-turn-helix domain-containing protein n=1 Tax=Pseudonocardia hydrocarbonoxydans TaxID=76726 RepID=UPI00114165DD